MPIPPKYFWDGYCLLQSLEVDVMGLDQGTLSSNVKNISGARVYLTRHNSTLIS